MKVSETKGKCHDCGVLEGQIHHFGCDTELCPICGGQLITCDCCYQRLALIDRERFTAETNYLPLEVYEHGLADEQEAKWLACLETVGRIPYIRYPNMCARCGKLWPEMFKVSDDEWKHYVQPGMRQAILCRECYGWIKTAIDEGTVGRAESQ